MFPKLFDSNPNVGLRIPPTSYRNFARKEKLQNAKPNFLWPIQQIKETALSILKNTITKIKAPPDQLCDAGYPTDQPSSLTRSTGISSSAPRISPRRVRTSLIRPRLENVLRRLRSTRNGKISYRLCTMPFQMERTVRMKHVQSVYRLRLRLVTLALRPKRNMTLTTRVWCRCLGSRSCTVRTICTDQIHSSQTPTSSRTRSSA